jgi:hypothetical protein
MMCDDEWGAFLDTIAPVGKRDSLENWIADKDRTHAHDGLKDGVRPSVRRTSEMTGCGERTVTRSIRELQDAGVLKVERKAAQEASQ